MKGLKGFFYIAVFSAVVFSLSFTSAIAADNQVTITSFVKAGMAKTDLIVNFTLDSNDVEIDNLKTSTLNVGDALLKAGWTVVPDVIPWEQIPENIKGVVYKADDSTRCLITIRAARYVAVPTKKTIETVECGPAHSYNNGVFVRAELSSTTAHYREKDLSTGKWTEKMYQVPAVLERVYKKYISLKESGAEDLGPSLP